MRALLSGFYGRELGRYQAAAVRIGIGLAWLAYLLREWPNRRVLYGDRAPWSSELAERLLALTHAFTVLAWQHGRLWNELVYHLAILAALLLVLGWRTRASAALFAVTVLSLQNRDVLIGDGGDNLVHLMALYLLTVRCSLVWSLDARRSGTGGAVWLWAGLGAALALTEPSAGAGWWLWALWAVAGIWWAVNRWWPGGEPRAVLDALTTVLHNCGMLLIAAQVLLVYATAGWYKVQGARWQDGTALYYPLHLGYFTPWPALSGLLGGTLIVVFLLSYGTVLLQVALPFALVQRRLKGVLLVVLMAEHLGIAVLLGLPFFSLVMLAADAVLLPTAWLVAGGQWIRGKVWWLTPGS